jgi:hypothetical protein
VWGDEAVLSRTACSGGGGKRLRLPGWGWRFITILILIVLIVDDPAWTGRSTRGRVAIFELDTPTNTGNVPTNNDLALGQHLGYERFSTKKRLPTSD